jgi:hypothetical protein
MLKGFTYLHVSKTKVFMFYKVGIIFLAYFSMLSPLVYLPFVSSQHM